MIKISKNDVYQRMMDYGKTHFQKISTDDFVIGEAPFNRRCHLNAVQHVKNGTAVKVFSCYAVDKADNSHCIHFINQLEDGKYQDNTWGWRYKQNDYYIIKEITEEEQEHIWDSLNDLKKMFLFQNSSWVERKIYGLKYNDVI